MIQGEEVIREICREDHRYTRECYRFVRYALEFTMQRDQERREAMRAQGLTVSNNPHVTGKDLLRGIRDLSRERFGPLAPVVFRQWGVQSTEDFGRVVFNMVEAELMSKQETDTLDDFKDGFDFETAFEVEPDLKILD